MIISDINFSLSREAVPLPIATISTLYLSIKFLTINLLSLTSLLFLLNGYITQEYKYLPVLSITASLHPLVKPGSNASTIFSLIGGCSKSASTFLLKLLIASILALSVRSLLISLSIDGYINLLKLSIIASLTISHTKLSLFLIILSSK